MPFTSDEFFGVFALYNRRFIVVVVALWLASAGMVAFVSRDPERRSRTLSLFLAGTVAVECGRLSRALLHADQSCCVVVRGLVRGPGRSLLVVHSWQEHRLLLVHRMETPHRAGRRRICSGISVPDDRLGHSYPETPTFGVPCPTAILTIGLLVGARGHLPLTLAIVPIVWGFIGGSAAVLLAVPTDYVLLGSGLLLTAILVVQRVQPGRLVP